MEHPAWIAINLGCGRGYSVLEIVRAFEKASRRKVPYTICPRRAGGIAANWYGPALAEKLLGWEAKYGIDVPDQCKLSVCVQSKSSVSVLNSVMSPLVSDESNVIEGQDQSRFSVYRP